MTKHSQPHRGPHPSYLNRTQSRIARRRLRAQIRALKLVGMFGGEV